MQNRVTVGAISDVQAHPQA
jgi:hypothetical protein